MPNIDDIDSDDLDNFAQVKEIKKKPKKKNKGRTINVRIDEEESEMVDTLRSSPHFVNLSEFLRASIRHYYKRKVLKQGKEE